MISIRERLLQAFQIEYREHVEAIRTLLDDLGHKAEGSGLAQLDEIFRRAHSLKGAARAVDLPPIEEISHRMETLFARVRSGQAKLDSSMAMGLGHVLDVIEDWVAANMANEPLPDTSDTVIALEAMIGGQAVDIHPSVAASPVVPPRPVPVPASEPPPPSAAPPPVEEEEEPSSAERSASPVRPEETVRVRAEHLDRLLRSSNELLTETMNQRQVTQSLLGLDRTLSDFDRSWRRARKNAAAALRDLGDYDRAIALERQYEALEQNLTSIGRELRSVRRRQQRTGWALRQLGNDLQQEVRQVRMVPADSIFGAFRKMVRDLARAVGKQVTVQVSGLDVEADRMVLQGLKDPVMHLLRNALSHGVEPPDERKAAGRPAAAHVGLSFDVSEGRLVVLIEDDGRGVNFEAIRRKAVERGLFSEAQSFQMDRQSLIDIIFDPGFSTARVVDDLSGRGMGLSVVREAMAMMNGTVEVLDRQPMGTCFRLSLPLTVSTQRLFLVECQGHVYGLPTEGVDRLYRVRAEDVGTVEGKSVVFLGDRQIPLLSLAHLLALGESAVKVTRNVVPLVVLKNGERRVAVAIDGFLSIREGLVKDIGVPGARGTMVAGGVLLEDGDIALVLNPFEIVETFRKSGSIRVLTTVEKPAEKRVPVILVVDDSLTTRTLEKSILEAHGYQVRLAHDGLEALGRLRAEQIDLIISDIQMPRLDGFGLLQAVKADPALKSIPLILVSSLEARADKERGLELGADAYVVKRKFDQKDLLETIEQFL
ncbi:Signal transduction histidine kinase CheA [Paramagnetospirillum magnetotacticum MS-1]|uniref:Chemotaxis protein CheA n=1 Tax=Paramagnetospirillum magnetotacticum MS-1 TaxID=272627 RepID=A0A0C2V5N4_PARME|nr:response regulator [Paramagnetospirillum magnetotacticum]KIM00382.1 Signal transduction histidine kinase CheA [Paramagnetospirillum magnetotacticum MS-1]